MYHQIGKKKVTAILLILLLTFSVVGFSLPAFGNGPIDPSSVEVTLYPGESHEVEKTVSVPEIPPKLDLLLLEDETGSFYDDIDRMQGTEENNYEDGLAMAIWDGIVIEGTDFRGGVAGFRDFAQDNWGSTYMDGSFDWVYRLLQDLTADRAAWKNGILDLSANGGADDPEAQLAALMSAADGTAWDSNNDGTDDSGPAPSWRSDAVKVIALVTDAPYHENGDPPLPGWPGPTEADTITALTDAGIHVIVITTKWNWDSTIDLEAYYEDLASNTGGSVKLISSSSAGIVEAITEGLGEILTDVWGIAECEGGIEVTLLPEVHEDVSSGTDYEFKETIYVPEGTGGGIYHCTVTFYSNSYPEEGAEIGTQDIYVTVPYMVDIDIKPGSYPNSINMRNKNGVIAVALFNTDHFDVSMVDHLTVTFGPDEATPAHKDICAHMEDVDGDGDLDVVYHFEAQETGLDEGDVEAYLKGLTLGGILFEGKDSVRILVKK